MIRHTARYKSGIPEITTVPHAGSIGRLTSTLGKTKLNTSRTPPMMVIGSPARTSLIRFNISDTSFFLTLQAFFCIIYSIQNTLFHSELIVLRKK